MVGVYEVTGLRSGQQRFLSITLPRSSPRSVPVLLRSCHRHRHLADSTILHYLALFRTSFRFICKHVYVIKTQSGTQIYVATECLCPVADHSPCCCGGQQLGVARSQTKIQPEHSIIIMWILHYEAVASQDPRPTITSHPQETAINQPDHGHRGASKH